MKNTPIFDAELFDSHMKGMEIVHRAVSGTIGAAGRNVIMRKYGKPYITNDGVSTAEKITLVDEAQAVGADLIKQAAHRTDEEAGDGTSTAIMLSYAMVVEGYKKIKSGVNPMRLKREMELGLNVILKELKDQARPVSSDEELLNVANISVENPEIAMIVRDAVKKAGVDGTVVVDESTGLTIEKQEVDGLSFDKGYISPYMVTDAEKMEAVLTDPLGVHILITDKHLNMNNEAFKLLEGLSKKGVKQLLIISEDVSGELLSTAIANRMQGRFHVVCVKKPFFKETLSDIAVVTGGELLTAEKGISEFTEEHIPMLGRAKKIVVSKDKCSIIDGFGSRALIEERIKAIKTEMEGAESYEKGKLKDRLARIVGGVVIIKVGAPTEADMKYKKLKIDDAVNATRAAMEEGIVIGGGRTLFNISEVKAATEGEGVIRKACQSPIAKIIENAGEDANKILNQIRGNPTSVFNALTGTVTDDPIRDGIIDPVKVERCALVNAVSFASIFLTAHCSLVDVPEKGQEEQ